MIYWVGQWTLGSWYISIIMEGAEMDDVLQDAWRPVNWKYAEAPKEDPAEFLRRYGHHVRQVPMLASPLTGRRLRRALPQMRPSALGQDGWSLAELWALPDALLECVH